ncbi:MAG: hypothetical protein A3H23_06660 [Planctomycetes bacterium RIFCSPLOWO2_12_FULL_40_19]|nr:MAG: hypothetical protein A3H23_06660 [Planctomycetes bacterium RIFCSPLOWO2_12_FULL_40_19]
MFYLFICSNRNFHLSDFLCRGFSKEDTSCRTNQSNKGKVVILDLWATWCPPCRKEIPGFINLYKKYKDKGLEIIGVAFDENGQEVVPPFMKAMGINYPVYLDGGDIAMKYDLQAYPTTIVYGKDVKAASKHVGYVSEEEFENELRELLKKKEGPFYSF